MKPENRSLISGILGSAGKFPERPALVVEKRSYTYGELLRIASSYAAALDARAISAEPLLTAVFAMRSLPAYAGIVAALLRGHGYVPLNRSYPVNRTEFMIRKSGCRALIVDEESSRLLDEVLARIDYPLVILLPELEDSTSLKAKFPRHIILGMKDLAPGAAYTPKTPLPDSIAYVIFTSGSTGTPKGVMTSNANIRSYGEYAAGRGNVTERDRFSQSCATTFDGSVFDLFTAWLRGACVCSPSQKELLNPGAFIKRHEITVWFSVPSLAVFMKRLGSLKKGNFPSLRWSTFGGEALSQDIVAVWREAAPNSEIDNGYGPTETTCMSVYYRWDPVRSPSEVHKGIVPIGYPNPGMSVLVCDENLREVAPGEKGELLMAGPQISLGYLSDPERTKKAYVVPPGRDEIYYRTGDLVERPRGDGPILYFGRIDFQIKVLGHRVELGEIEAAIREETGIHGVVALGWPVTPNGAQGVEAFIEAESCDVAGLKKRLSERLPEFMVPKKFHMIRRIPLNDNGKFDRFALQRILEAVV
ncbi:MAG: amino acid adenylation domain-containing protein [Candidatus Krumholzibacteria bacterium]|nr:amino acid adenylation domain-containing protein [Candidatus Krumholzibacteria bacterium]